MSPNDIFQLLNASGFGAYAMSVDQVILFWSSGAQRILGHRREEVLGRRCYEVVAGTALDGFTPECLAGCPSMRALRAGLAPTPVKLRMLCASGQRKLVTLTPMVVAGVLEAGPMLVHLFHDSTDEAGSSVDAGAVRDALQENGASILPEDIGVEAPAENAPALTLRELEVLRLVSLGRGTPRIAEELGISYHTVRNHIRHCRRKLGAATKLDAVLTAIRRGILPVE